MDSIRRPLVAVVALGALAATLAACSSDAPEAGPPDAAPPAPNPDAPDAPDAPDTRDAAGGTGAHAADAGSLDAPTAPSPSPGVLAPGRLYFGVCGHYGWDGYENVTAAQQIADIQDIFGSAPGTVVYRAWEGDATEPDVVAQETAPFLAAGILPAYIIFIHPTWSTFASEAEAFQKTYAATKAFVAKNPDLVYEIGNEWVNDELLPKVGDGSHVSDWAGAASFDLAVGVHAGTIAALRDASPHTVIVGGANVGWTYWALPQAILERLTSYVTPDGQTRNLTWNFTSLHQYQDVGSGNQQGTTLSAAVSADYYTAMKGALAPLAVTEVGSSTRGSTSNEAAAGAQLVQFLNDMKAHTATTATETGVRYFDVYELYGPDTEDYYLRHFDGTITPQGAAVKGWISTYVP